MVGLIKSRKNRHVYYHRSDGFPYSFSADSKAYRKPGFRRAPHHFYFLTEKKFPNTGQILSKIIALEFSAARPYSKFKYHMRCTRRNWIHFYPGVYDTKDQNY